MSEIKFGTDGWRGVIADDYTFENVRRAAGAIAATSSKHEDPRKGVVVGYDTRFGSRSFARAAAEVLAGAGIPVRFSNDYTPTPAISYMAKHLDTAGGVMITSSHNPWSWNGMKFKENLAARRARRSSGRSRPNSRPAPCRTGRTKSKSGFQSALCCGDQEVRRYGLISRLASNSRLITCTARGGACSAHSAQRGVDVVEIRSEVNPLFPGINPGADRAARAHALQDTVVKERCHAGFATTATPTASAPSPKTAASSMRTSVTPSCWSGSWNTSSGRAR